MNLTCVNENIIEIRDGVCECHQGYYGDSCEFFVPYYRSSLISLYLISTLLTLISIIMLSSRFFSFSWRKTNLATICTIFCLVGNIMRIVYFWMPSKSIYNVYQGITLTIIRTILNYVSLTCISVSSSLVVLFWYEIIRSKFKLNISSITKICSFLIISIMVLCLIPGIYFLSIDDNFFGLLFIAIPLIVNTLFLLVMVVVIYKIKNSEENIIDSIKDKKKWAVKFLFAVSMSWMFFIFSLVLTSIIRSLDNEYIRIIPQVCLSLSYSIIPLFTSILLDYKFRMLKTFIKKIKCLNIDYTDSTNTTQNSNLSDLSKDQERTKSQL
jgi:hypothetical protein